MRRFLLPVLALVLFAAPGLARAESGRFNVHLQAGAAGPPAGFLGDLAVDWQFLQPIALEVTIGGGALFPGQNVATGADLTTGVFATSAGARFRFADDQSGYPGEGGSVAGNFWFAPHIGFAVLDLGAALTVDVAVGYEISVASPVSIGLYVRPMLVVGERGIGALVTGGVTVSFEIDPLREDVDPDRDHDGVLNAQDRCPRTPVGSEVDARGCVPMVAVLVLDGITFAFDSASIEPSSETTLRRAAQMLSDNPEVRVEIGGHTDDVGTVEHNDALSRERAQSVVDWLVANGIERSRLRVRGYGSAQPRVPNTDEGSRARNRRIEFRQLDAR